MLCDNLFTNLPTHLCLSKSIKELSTSGNPLQYPPQQILSQGWSHIKDFLKTICKHPDLFDDTIEIVQGVNIQEIIDDRTNPPLETRSKEMDATVNENQEDTFTLERDLSKSSVGSSDEATQEDILQER